MSGRRMLSDERQLGVLQRLASLGIVWFYVTMMVESSIFPITDVIFEHRIYLSSVGFCLTAAAVTAMAGCSGTAGFKKAWSLFAVICVVLGGLTISRNQVWSNTLMLWQDTVRKSPNKDLAVANLAGEYMRLNMPGKALPLFVRALELNQVQLTDTKVYLGKALQCLEIDGSRFTTGEEITSQVEHTGRVTLDRKEKNRLQSIMKNNMGLAYEYLGEAVKAKLSFRAALMINPEYDLAWYNLGLISIKSGDKEQAVKAQLQLEKLNPSLAGQLAKSALEH
jgi:tetratricopeptide (TPR) repeat protein